MVLVVFYTFYELLSILCVKMPKKEENNNNLSYLILIWSGFYLLTVNRIKFKINPS